MSITKATSGFALQIHSWENDLNFVASKILWGLSRETLDDVIKILETLKRIGRQRDLKLEHYEELFPLCTDRVMLEIAKYDEPLSKADKDNFRSIFSDVLYKLGLSPMNPEYYTLRIVDHWEVRWVEFG